MTDNPTQEELGNNQLPEKQVHNAEPVFTERGIDKFMLLATVSHENISEAIKAEIAEGNVNPVQMLVALKKMEKIVKLTIDSSEGDKEIREILKNGVAKALDGGKSVDMFGATLTIRATRTWYDFTECGDQYLNELYNIKKKVDEAIKKREDEIKVLCPPDSNKLSVGGRTIVQEFMPHFEFVECGEDNVIFPPVKMQSDGVVVTFKKQK